MKKIKLSLIGLIITFGLNAQNKLESTGNVGVGTLTPTEKFQVNEGNIGIFGYNTSRYIRFTEANLQGAFINYDGTNNVFNIGVNDSNSTDAINDVNAISIARTTGNVGIGTLTPTEKFQVNEGNIGIFGYNTSRYIRFTEANLQGAFINYDGTNNVLNIGVNDVNSTDSANDTNAISIARTSGNVGIGTLTPTEKLQVNEGNIGVFGYNTSRYIRFTETNLQGAFINYDGTNNILNIGVNDINSTDSTNDYNAISIVRGNGNVGIGTTDTKGFKLGVNGKIAATEVKIATYTNWSDFVFEKNYSLPTLNEVEKHIKEKGHLKDIPSAEKVKKEGFFLAKMDASLLQKIEELTLYTIQQEKKITKLETLNSRIKQLEQENNVLKSLLERVALLEKEIKK